MYHLNKCDQIWRKVLGDYVRAYLVLGKNLNLLWSTFSLSQMA